MSTTTDVNAIRTTALLLLAGLATGCTSMAQQREIAVHDVLPGQCPNLSGQYYNFPEVASVNMFSSASYDRINCDDTEFCTLSSIFDEETGYHAVVNIEHRPDGALVFSRENGDTPTTIQRSEFSCGGGSITLFESEAGQEGSLRHLTQLSLDPYGSLLARIGVFMSGPDEVHEGPVRMVFADSAWLKFEGVDENNRKDWGDPVATREHLGFRYADLSGKYIESSLQGLCDAANTDRYSTAVQTAEYGWWFQESVWEFSYAWDELLVQALLSHGIRPDNRMAYMWLQLAGHEYPGFFGNGSYSLDTSVARRTLADEMTPAEVETARQMANEWKPDECAGPSSSTLAVNIKGKL